MQQRDNALQQIKDLIKQKNDEILKVESEISGLKNETQKEQQTAEELAQKLRKCQANLEA
jgi:archaellum component FlaC